MSLVGLALRGLWGGAKLGARAVPRVARFGGREALRFVSKLDQVAYDLGTVAGKVAFSRTTPSLANLYTGFRPKPWLAGSIAFMALMGGLSTGRSISTAMHAQPTGQMPAMTWDGIPNLPDNMGADGELGFALYRNRHG
jgi:hypothetical protein